MPCRVKQHTVAAGWLHGREMHALWFCFPPARSTAVLLLFSPNFSLQSSTSPCFPAHCALHVVCAQQHSLDPLDFTSQRTRSVS
jgi:hypothetical protein